MFKLIRHDAALILARDPAARSKFEVYCLYPGFHALLLHRGAHGLWRRGFKFSARLVAYFARIWTGIEIHPGALIGRGVFIDHGTGLVIGETAEIGDNVTLYQGVTLGGVTLNQGKRHPTLENDVIVGAGAQVLGPIVIGRGARIGANSVVTRNVAAGDTVTGIPAHSKNAKRNDKFMAYGLPCDGDVTNGAVSHDVGLIADCHERLAVLSDEVASLRQILSALEQKQRSGG
ncbi:MAG: serine O-acetyltransferase [Candidatus Symbiobacter sp.]|nr:serine O-acetyltransferase [Candidatus Symbiobacter sp.]